MTPLLRITLLYSLVPVVFTIIGAAAGVSWSALARYRSYVLHLAAGVVFSVVAVELLPEIQQRARVGGGPVRDVVLGFALGIGTMLVVDKLLDRLRGGDDDERQRPEVAVSLSLFVAVGVDFILDGLLLGVGFAAGARIGILLALAEAAEQLSVGL